MRLSLSAISYFCQDFQEIPSKPANPQDQYPTKIIEHQQLPSRPIHSTLYLQVLMNHTGTISVKDLSAKTSIKPEDVRTTLEEHLNLVQMVKGQKVICADPEILQK